MGRRFVDLSIYLENDVVSDPTSMRPGIFTRPWMAERARSRSMRCRSIGAFGPGVKLDFRHLPDDYVVAAADVAAELARIGYESRPLDIVLINTAAGKALGAPNFVNVGCGMGYKATIDLASRAVRVTGTDAWSWDAPFSRTARRVAASGDTSLICEGHKAGRDIGYCHLEKLHYLETLPPYGCTVACFPHKVRDASAGWTRAVAILDD